MMKPTTILLQNVDTAETRSIVKACYLEDIAKFRSNVDDLHKYKDLLLTGNCLPVGSVEFVKKAMQLSDLGVPTNFEYHDSLMPYSHRKIELSTAGTVRELAKVHSFFVKPVETKLFTGFVIGPNSQSSEDEHVQQCLEEMSLLDIHEPVWVSEVIDFVCEYRYYFKSTRLLGACRYDDGPDDVPVPSVSIVQEAARSFFNQTQVQSFCLDFGVDSSGKTVLVEANDAWAIGLYGIALNGPQYLDFLYTRWCQIFCDNKVNYA